MSIVWNTGRAAERARFNLKLKKALKDGAYKRWKKLLKQKLQASSSQASSSQASSATKKTQLNDIKKIEREKKNVKKRSL